MTYDEYVKNIPNLSIGELLDKLDYCGFDSYYRTVREPVVAEIRKRLTFEDSLEKENALVKSLLYCTKRTCDNCGFVKCKNFQRQRKSVPCDLYISYQARIKNLENESDVLMESYNNSEKNLGYVTERLAKATEIIKKLVEGIRIISDPKICMTDVDAFVSGAEQFLSEVEKC